MTNDKANHQENDRKPAPHISMELKADSARVTNLQMQGSKLILTIEAELSDSQLKAADPTSSKPVVPAPTDWETQETPAPDTVVAGSLDEDEPADTGSDQKSESEVFSLPDAVAAGVPDLDSEKEALEEKILEEVFSVGADKDTVETMNPLSFSGSAVAPSSYGAPPTGDAQENFDPLHVFAEFPSVMEPPAAEEDSHEDTDVKDEPAAAIGDSVFYERLEDEIRKVKGKETAVHYKRPYSEDVQTREKVADDSSKFPNHEADDTVPLPHSAINVANIAIDEEEDTLAAIKPDAFSEVLAAEQAEKQQADYDQHGHYATETGPLPGYPSHISTEGLHENGDRSEDLDTATQQISYQNMSEQDKNATYNQNSLEEDEEQPSLEAADRSTEQLRYEQNEKMAINEPAQEQPQASEAGEDQSPEQPEAMQVADSDVQSSGAAEAATAGQGEDNPPAGDAAADDKVLTVSHADLDDMLVLSEESSAFGGERHGEPLPSINFGFDPLPASTAPAEPVEQPLNQAAGQEPMQEEEQATEDSSPQDAGGDGGQQAENDAQAQPPAPPTEPEADQQEQTPAEDPSDGTENIQEEETPPPQISEPESSESAEDAKNDSEPVEPTESENLTEPPPAPTSESEDESTENEAQEPARTEPAVEDNPERDQVENLDESSAPTMPGCGPDDQENPDNGPTLNTGEPPRTPTGGTTVLIRYTCPKCKTQGMQAVDKVGTVVNCTNCGKAMRLVMKK